MPADRWWNVHVYGWPDVVLSAASVGAAKYAVWRAMSDAGYFSGRDGFWEMLVSGCRAWGASELDVRTARANGRLLSRKCAP